MAEVVAFQGFHCATSEATGARRGWPLRFFWLENTWPSDLIWGLKSWDLLIVDGSRGFVAAPMHRSE